MLVWMVSPLKDKQTTNNMHQRLSTVIKCHQIVFSILANHQRPPACGILSSPTDHFPSVFAFLAASGGFQIWCVWVEVMWWSQIVHKWSHKMIIFCWAVHLLFQTIILAHGPCPHYLKPVTDVTSPLEKSGQRKRRPKPRQQTDFASWITISVILFPTQPMDRNHLHQSH